MRLTTESSIVNYLKIEIMLGRRKKRLLPIQSDCTQVSNHFFIFPVRNGPTYTREPCLLKSTPPRSGSSAPIKCRLPHHNFKRHLLFNSYGNLFQRISLVFEVESDSKLSSIPRVLFGIEKVSSSLPMLRQILSHFPSASVCQTLVSYACHYEHYSTEVSPAS